MSLEEDGKKGLLGSCFDLPASPFGLSVTLTWCGSVRRPPRDPIGQCPLQLLYLRILRPPLIPAKHHHQNNRRIDKSNGNGNGSGNQDKELLQRPLPLLTTSPPWQPTREHTATPITVAMALKTKSCNRRRLPSSPAKMRPIRPLIRHVGGDLKRVRMSTSMGKSQVENLST
jgi:hypothetical protein